MDTLVLLIFFFVYAGMMLGEIPGFALDRSGVALLGAIALLVSGRVSMATASAAVDLPTMSLLFGLMVLSAQLRLGGFYTQVTRTIVTAPVTARGLLGLLVVTAGVLSALLANDIVCLAVAPLLIEACSRRKLDPVPFLLALACAANVGSAATLIGNPQNMLVGEALHLSFAGYLFDAGVPAIFGLGAVWWVVARCAGSRWTRETPTLEVAAPRFDRWQSVKGVAVLLVLVGLFLLSSVPRGVVALAAAGVLLTSRRMASRDMLGLVDWHLLVLFAALFVVNRALAESGTLAAIFNVAAASGFDLQQPAWLFTGVAVLSNLVSNVPAVMLLLPAAQHPFAGPILALASTFAGNLLVVGSIANIIVVEQAARAGIEITWRDHVRIGAPVTAITLAAAAVWLWVRSLLGAG